MRETVPSRAQAARVRDYLRSRPETADGEFTLPMVTCGIRTVRAA